MSLDLLAIAAHPDDVEQTCGGTLIKMAEVGYRTGVLDLTAGDMGTRGTPEQRLIEAEAAGKLMLDRKSTRLNSSHQIISYAVFCLKKKKNIRSMQPSTACIIMH